ncbi:uncharacterized protein BDR25DRAFT_250586 [Lindgomyces ingoldianus]|uniref:Uncharacterized protein n=1 Tax=Lindgomyces ingoldianus TaxID=673940 RepID=A0ACB6RHW0_9PLEO|nr:uncharacterized protein BDR25DRAFT_250586 [Lindgomyces ingoldianus]KAF2478056.1 hypothetical protein BDR25DRAFT_250586 [Lindgomyces ingoldianus]
MVYTGKPSRGCQMCKNRRIKCDEKRPICGQCQKSGRTCPGYPDEFDLVFRDENKAMERKRKTSGSGSKSVGGSQGSPSSVSPSSTFEISPGASPPSFAESSRSRTPPDASQGQLVVIPPYQVPPDQATFQAFMWSLEHGVPPTITTSPEVEAVPFFFRNFVSLPQQAESMRGFLELLVPLYNQARPSSALHQATSAVALAACGNYPGRQDLLREAATAYGKALRQLNDDLKDPAVSKSDETVLAILLFSLYETIMSTNDTITAWANHVDGAVALTKLRGAEQFKNPMSHAVFRAVRTMMITSCVQRSKPIDTFPGQHGWVGTENNEENAANRLTLICIDLPNIRARATALTTAPHNNAQRSEALAILEFAQMVDANLQQWSNTLPPDWQYTTVAMVYDMPEDLSTAEQWSGPQHVYEDVHIASIVNDYRVCRIFCQSVIIACINYLGLDADSPLNDAYNSAVFFVQQMVDEICACVPFHLSYDMQPVAKKLGQDQAGKSLPSYSHPPAEALGGYFMVWPLYVAANAETVPKRQRDWLSGRLFNIGKTFGLNSAQVLVLARRHVLTCGPMFP